ncbi:MAG: metal-dependent hydrolase [Microgenomates bacterium OLB22]|nr:MAG: metal-dependent hydrolase [Microgenomates bacterium OLB22]
MEIRYLGHSAFLLKGKTASLITDPFDPDKVGLPWPKSTSASIVTISHHHTDHNRSDLVEGNPLVIDLPGEYEKSGIRINGIESFHDAANGAERGTNTIFHIEYEGLTIVHCGDLGHQLDDDTLEQIGTVDILLIPVGGHYTIGPEEAVKVARAIDPRIIIPMHYGHPDLKLSKATELSSVQDFISATGTPVVEKLTKLVVKREDLVEEQAKVVILEAN